MIGAPLPVAALVIALSAAAASATGFGFNLVSAPLLAFVYAPRVVVVLTLLLGVCASGMLLLRPEVRRAVDWSVVRPLVLSSLGGMPLGAVLLLWGQPRTLRILIAGLTALFALVMLSGYRPRAGGGRYGILAAGALSGVLSTSTSLNGPPVVFYFLGQSLPKDRFRANVAAFVFLATLASLALLALGGTVSPLVAGLTLRLLPALLLGFAIGVAVANRLTDRRFDVAVLGFLVIVGLLGLGATLW